MWNALLRTSGAKAPNSFLGLIVGVKTPTYRPGFFETRKG
jgi:hypothetical protein